MTLSSYEKHEKLGEGSYGVVYRATRKIDNSIVALKIFKIENLDDGVPSTLLREISILKSLNHINVVQLIDVMTSSIPIFLAYEFVETDLRRLLIRKGPLKPNIVKSYAFQLFSGIDFLHSHRIIHRDVKPDNILLSRSGLLKLCDFGMARYFSVPMRPYTKGVVTIWYKAPELLVSNPYDLSIDIWSAGCIIFEMISGKPLFPGDGNIDQLIKILTVLGTNSTKEFKTFHEKVLSELNFEIPEYKGTGIQSLFRSDDILLIDLVSKCLLFNPADRITAKEALEHPYFNDISKEMRRACASCL